jgi:DNA modification methylase
MKEYSTGIVRNVKQARDIARTFIAKNYNGYSDDIEFGLPERNDRDSTWIIPIIVDFPWLIRPEFLGTILINWDTGEVTHSTDQNIVSERLNKARHRVEIPDSESRDTTDSTGKRKNGKQDAPPDLGCRIYLGESQKVLQELPKDAVQLIVTSPPYFNAKPSYAEYVDYEQYLDELESIFAECHRILSEGRFLIVNSSPILQRRIGRQYSSRRIPVPFDIHARVTKLGYEFVDDIIWEKPEGAGWSVGRGRRFRADRNPLQYKPVPVTEYFMVYRKATRKLIDWNIRKHHDENLVEASKITGEYRVTNVWKATPAHHSVHPAVFPVELIRDFVRYYSFVDDTVLDPFAGIGTVGCAAFELQRKAILIDSNEEYVKTMVNELSDKAYEAGYGLKVFPEGLQSNNPKNLPLL